MRQITPQLVTLALFSAATAALPDAAAHAVLSAPRPRRGAAPSFGIPVMSLLVQVAVPVTAQTDNRLLFAVTVGVVVSVVVFTAGVIITLLRRSDRVSAASFAEFLRKNVEEGSP